MGLIALSNAVKNFIKFSLIFLFAASLLWGIWQVINELFSDVFKLKGPPTAYGKISAPFFTKNFFPLKIENLSVPISLPDGEEKALVYKIVNGQGFTKEMQEDIAEFFFLTGYQKENSGNFLYWETSDGTNLKIDNSRRSFEYRYNYLNGDSYLRTKIDISETAAIEKVTEHLKKLKLMSKNMARSIKEGGAIIRYLKIENGQKTETTKDQANVVEVSIFSRIDKLFIAGNPSVRVLLSAGGKKILEFNYSALFLDNLPSAYPIINATTAIEKIKSGAAFVSEDLNINSAEVKAIELFYWSSEFYEPHLQPIWIVSLEAKMENGKKEVEAYIPAISPSFLVFAEEVQDQVP